jgi:hypothetical protein
MAPLGRLTCIIMPHHGSISTLRPRQAITAVQNIQKATSLSSDMRSWTPIRLLKYGLEKKLYRKKGWLFDLLKKEGST